MKRLNGSKKRLVLIKSVVVVMLIGGAIADAGSGAMEITVLYDNYTLTEGCIADWGFACIIKGTEKCILFDAGTNGGILLGNMDKLQVSAGDVELVVISHDHTDHTGGLSSFLGRNNKVTTYLPLSASAGLVQTVESRGATAILPDDPMQICEGAHVVGMPFMGQIEQFLILETPKGLVVITGCAHPGIVQIVQKAKQLLGQEVYFVFGGFHLLNDSDSQVISKIRQFQSLGVQKCGASHCTGDRAISLFRQEYGADFVPIGVGKITIPIECDFNRDGIVDSTDLCIMVDHWHMDEPSFDIAPPLFGDGIVDIQDLIVFADHLFTYPGAVAYWTLDETEGAIAYDSVGDCDGTLMGNPVWQPDGGVVDGALQFDGIDDYVRTNPIFNPSEGVFSVVAWIKGGAPGQVVISQTDGANWLLADPSGGNVMTELKGSGRGSVALLSQTAIADGNWHRVGFVWDGSDRILYVDNVEVVRDKQTDLKSSEGGLYFGVGNTLSPNTFWSGLIDDIRIYDRVVSP